MNWLQEVVLPAFGGVTLVSICIWQVLERKSIAKSVLFLFLATAFICITVITVDKGWRRYKLFIPKNGHAYEVVKTSPGKKPDCWEVELQPWPKKVSDGQGPRPHLCGIVPPKEHELVHWDNGKMIAFIQERPRTERN